MIRSLGLRRGALLALPAAALVALAARAEPAASPAAVPPGPLFAGATYERLLHTGDEPMVVHVVALDLSRPGLRFGVTPGDNSKGMEHIAKTTSAFLAESGAQLAINASFFLPFAGGSPGGDDYYPKAGDPANVSGAAIAQGRPVSPVETGLDIRVNAMLCFSAAQALIVDGQRCPAGSTDGVAAGPRLLAGGAQSSFTAFDNRQATTRHPRTAFGLSADRRKAWIVVVDGRQPGYSAGATLPELAAIFRKLGAADAINLDGGGSTTLVIRGSDGRPKLVNVPIHTGMPGRERPVANHIAVYAVAAEAQ